MACPEYTCDHRMVSVPSDSAAISRNRSHGGRNLQLRHRGVVRRLGTGTGPDTHQNCCELVSFDRLKAREPKSLYHHSDI